MVQGFVQILLNKFMKRFQLFPTDQSCKKSSGLPLKTGYFDHFRVAPWHKLRRDMRMNLESAACMVGVQKSLHKTILGKIFSIGCHLDQHVTVIKLIK